MADFAPPMDIQDEVMAFLLTSPTPQQINAFRASEAAQQRQSVHDDPQSQRTHPLIGL